MVNPTHKTRRRSRLAIGILSGLFGLTYAVDIANAELPPSEFSVDPAQQALNQIMSMMEQERASLSTLGVDRLAELSGMGVQRASVAPSTDFLGLNLGGRAQEDAVTQTLATNGQVTSAGDFGSNLGIGFNKAVLDAMPSATGGRQWQCLSEALYFEARSENLAGQFAVGEVILNRVDSTAYPNTVCEVVQQGAHRLNACQFSYNCDGKAEHFTEALAFARSGKLAKMMLDGTARVLTGGATHYHTTSIMPGWARRLENTAQIGSHQFYRQPRS